MINHPTALRSLLLAAALPLMLVGCQSTATNHPPSELERYNLVMEDVKESCPTCETARRTVLNAMNQQCNLPLTVDNMAWVVSSHPMYTVALVANFMLADSESTQQTFNHAISNNVNCWNADIWIASTKEQFQSIVTSTHEQESDQ